MHRHSIETWQHSHVFLGMKHAQNERKTWFVIGLTTLMMIVEISGGHFFGSMALVADGWHMSTHAGALGISALAYTYARQHRDDTRFAFGTGKLGDLAGFTSAIVLSMIAVLIMYQAVQRLMAPIPINFKEAIAVAVLGLSVNVVSVWMLYDHHDGDHRPSHDHHEAQQHQHHHDHHHDNNLRSAYLHVLADAATSVLAIVGLLLGWIYGWLWVDALMGIVGAFVIVNWSVTLMRDAGRVLLDVNPDETLRTTIRQILETDGDLVTDLHIWQVGPGHYGTIVSVLTDYPKAPSDYKNRLSELKLLSHITIEVHECPLAESLTPRVH